MLNTPSLRTAFSAERRVMSQAGRNLAFAIALVVLCAIAMAGLTFGMAHLIIALKGLL